MQSHISDASHMYVTHVTIAKKGNYISSGAHFSGLPEYTSPIIYGSPLIEKRAKYSKKCGAVEIFFSKSVLFDLIMQNYLAIQNMLDS
jgi:hypothetical protein